MKVVVCGSRKFENPSRAREALRERMVQLPSESLIIQGAAPGADRWARDIAKDLGMETKGMPARWDVHGGCTCSYSATKCSYAGYRRNLEMLDEGPELVIALYNGFSRGTKHTIEHARRRDIFVEILLVG